MSRRWAHEDPCLVETIEIRGLGLLCAYIVVAVVTLTAVLL